MNSLTPLQALGLTAALLWPGVALAQQAESPPDGPPPAMSTPSAQQRAAMEADRAQLEALHQQARVRMLGSLSPAHRAQFAALVGQYAIAAQPNPEYTARQIDALLSAQEARNILAVAAGERDSARSIMQAARTQFEATLTADQKARMQGRMEHMKAEHAGDPERSPRPTDAGSILLHVALGYGRMHGPPPGAP